jgi:hypothetical protein
MNIEKFLYDRRAKESKIMELKKTTAAALLEDMSKKLPKEYNANFVNGIGELRFRCNIKGQILSIVIFLENFQETIAKIPQIIADCENLIDKYKANVFLERFPF